MVLQPLVLGVFAEYFGNPLTWVFCGVFIGLGILLGIFLRPWVGNQVIKFIPADHRFIDLDIDEETAISIQCKKKKGMPLQRFFKLRPGFTGIVGRILKKPITRYLGIEGTAYTWKLEGGKWIKLGLLVDAVRSLWGEAFWESVPETQKEKLTESKINVTVGLKEAPLTPAGMRSISEEDIKSEEDRKASKTFWEEHGSSMKGILINTILAGGFGFAVCAALILFGVIRLPSADPAPVIQYVNQTAQTVGAFFRGILG